MAYTTKTKKYMYWGASFISLTVLLFCAYYLLGGLRSPVTFIIDNPSVNVAGIEVKGNTVYHEEKAAFNKIKNIIEEGNMNGDLCIINYPSDTMNRHDMNRFIGVLLEEDASRIPAGLSIRKISAKRSYNAALAMHPLVMPNSEKIEKLLQEMAKNNGDSLRKNTLEVLYSDNSVIVKIYTVD